MVGVVSTVGKIRFWKEPEVGFWETNKEMYYVVNIGRREIFFEAGRCTELLQDCVQ
jgi:hypothetical protein